MNLPYENATSGSGAIDEIQKILHRFGCQRFGHMVDNDLGELIVQFGYRGRDVVMRANYKGYAVAWLKAHQHTSRMRRTRVEHELAALRQAQISVCSVLRDEIKGSITAIECGIRSFEGAFLGSILLSNGSTVLQELEDRGMLRLEAPKERAALG